MLEPPLGIFLFSLELCGPLEEHQEQNAQLAPGVSFSSAQCDREGQDIGSGWI
jgi:hypothetical protein